VNIPTVLFRTMQASKLYFLNMPFEERLQNLVKAYGEFDKEQLADGIMRIKKRLGGLETKTALSYLDQNEMANCFSILLRYYDKYYKKCLEEKNNKTRNIVWIDCNTSDTVTNMRQLLLQEESEVVG
jgi:tRNA 2-selenouridine synthase